MAQWVTGHVVGNRQWSERLHSLRVDAEIESFDAGQFIKLGLQIGGEVVGRPYSLVNPPHERPLEFYFIVLPDGPLSPGSRHYNPAMRYWSPRAPTVFLLWPNCRRRGICG